MKRWQVALKRGDEPPLAVRESRDQCYVGVPSSFYHRCEIDSGNPVFTWMDEHGAEAVLFIDAPDELGAWVAAKKIRKEQDNG